VRKRESERAGLLSHLLFERDDQTIGPREKRESLVENCMRYKQEKKIFKKDEEKEKIKGIFKKKEKRLEKFIYNAIFNFFARKSEGKLTVRTIPWQIEDR
jgi:hypothetical protein